MPLTPRQKVGADDRSRQPTVHPGRGGRATAPRHAQPSLRQRARDRRWSWGHTSVHHPGRTAAAIAEQARTEALIARLRVVPGRGEPRRDVLEQGRSEEHTSELQSLMRISYAVFCLKNKKTITLKK